MFILAKSFTNKKGEMFLKIFPKQYPSIETAHAAMQSDYQDYAPNWLTVSVLYAINEVV